jgi:hypothetical protein
MATALQLWYAAVIVVVNDGVFRGAHGADVARALLETELSQSRTPEWVRGLRDPVGVITVDRVRSRRPQLNLALRQWRQHRNVEPTELFVGQLRRWRQPELEADHRRSDQPSLGPRIADSGPTREESSGRCAARDG